MREYFICAINRNFEPELRDLGFMARSVNGRFNPVNGDRKQLTQV